MIVATLSRNRIKDILDSKGMSIYRLAKTVDMSYQAIHALVTADQIPSRTTYDTLKRIANVLQVEIGELEEDD